MWVGWGRWAVVERIRLVVVVVVAFWLMKKK